MIKAFKTMADAYRKIADDEDMSPEDRELVLQKIRVYDHMSLLEKKDIEIVYQSGMFNDLIRRDVSNALRDAHVNRDLFASVFRQMEIRWN